MVRSGPPPRKPRLEAGAEGQAAEPDVELGEVVRFLKTVGVNLIWKAATDRQRRIMIDDRANPLTSNPGISSTRGQPITVPLGQPFTVPLGEAGHRHSEEVGVEGLTCTISDWRLSAWVRG